MNRVFPKTHLFLVAALVASLGGFLCGDAYGQQKGKATKAKPAQKNAADAASVEPDKVLYERATTSMKHARFTEARLDFQTLINTYPDSEYLAKAKLGIADSFYKEGGVSNLTQSVEEYKNFIVFFPFLDEAQYAQMQVAMAHYRMMEKADRDTSQAEASEDEFREFMLKYPRSPLVPQAEQNLRNVQEVLADGEFKIAHFYYAKTDYSAAAARLLDVTGRYPLYSQSDQALWMLGEIYLRAKQMSKNEDSKNHWADLAGQCFDRIVQEYPLSTLTPAAKERLKSMGMPVPAAKPDALARMRQQELYEKEHHQRAALRAPMEMVKSSPDMYAAARTGQPNLNPPDDTISPTDVLNRDAAAPSFTIQATSVSAGGSESKPTVDTESVDTSGAADMSSGTASAPAAAVQMIDAPGDATIENSAPATAPPPELGPAPPANAAEPPSEGPNAFSDAAPSGGMPGSTSSATQTSSAQAAGAPAAASTVDPKTESTSKKKKGLRKLIP